MNIELPDNLIEQVYKNKIIPVIGAGVSKALKDIDGNEIFPSWEDFIIASSKELRAQLKDEHKNIVNSLIALGELQEAAEYARKGLTTNLWLKFLKKQFDLSFTNIDDNSTALSRNICTLSNKIISLNYDLSLEKISKQKITPRRIDNSDTTQLSKFGENEDENTLIWHLHGHIEAPEHIIATSSDYDTLYNSENDQYKAAVKVLEHLVTTNTFLFIGCSLSDIELLDVIQDQNNLFSGSTGPHYALIVKEESALIKQRLRAQNKEIEIIEFENFGKPLIDIVSQLSELKQTLSAEIDKFTILNKIGIQDERLATYRDIDECYYKNTYVNPYSFLKEVKELVVSENYPINILFFEQLSLEGDFLLIDNKGNYKKIQLESPFDIQETEIYLKNKYSDKKFYVQNISPQDQDLPRYLGFSIESEGDNKKDDTSEHNHPDTLNQALFAKIANLFKDIAIKNYHPKTIITNLTATNILLEQLLSYDYSIDLIHTFTVKINPKDLSDLSSHSTVFKALCKSLYLLHIKSLRLENIGENFLSFNNNTFLFWRTGSDSNSIKTLAKACFTELKKQLQTKQQTFKIELAINEINIKQRDNTSEQAEKLHKLCLKNLNLINLTNSNFKPLEIGRNKLPKN